MKKTPVILLLFFCLNAAASAQSAVLNLSDSLIYGLQEKTIKYDWAKARWEKVKELADQTLADTMPVQLPLRGGNWGHYYVDPEEGKPLVPGKYLGNWRWEHYNEAGTKIYYGDTANIQYDYDGVLILRRVHQVWANKLFALALTYRITGEPKYLQKIVTILEAYNGAYTQIPIHDKIGTADYTHGTGVGRVGAQALEESVWLVDMLSALGLVWNDLGTEIQMQTEKGLLLPAIDVIRQSNNLGIHNITCWYNAAVGMTGYLLKKDSLVHWALYRDAGLKNQLLKGFSANGHWHENAPSYHFYALKPFIALIETAKNNGNKEFIPYLEKTLDAPLSIAMPDLQLPRLNDCRQTYLPAYGEFYEYAYAVLGKTSYLPIVEQYRKQLQIPKEKAQSTADFNAMNYTLLYGKSIPANFRPFEVNSSHYAADGFDILVSGEGQNTVWLIAKYDAKPALGWHAHPDALSFVLYAKQTLISADPGHAQYGAPVHQGWYKTTLAHNTLVVNESNQAILPATHIAFGKIKNRPYSIVKTDSAYVGVSAERVYFLADENTVVIADMVRAKKPELLETVYHQRGTWKDKPEGDKWLHADKAPYKYLTNAEIIKAPKRTYVYSTQIGDREVKVQRLCHRPVQLITATGNGMDFEPTPLTILRTKAKRLSTLTVIHPNGELKPVRFKYRQNKLIISIAQEKFSIRRR